MSKILIVDDEAQVLSAFEEILAEAGHEVVTARRAETAMLRLEAEPFDLAIMDIRMPGLNGLDALRRIKHQQPKLPVIIMTGHGSMETAVDATKLGAFDYQLKPFEPAEMMRTIDKALQSARLMRGHVDMGAEAGPAAGDAIIGQSSAMQEVYKAIGRVASTDATVLIRGESGTGKELVARAIYHHSLRGEHPLMVVNCVAIPETLLESELFGYEPGAFTGANTRRIGKFEQADGGTVLLDEVGDLPPGIQAKILRVLQERSFERLGGNKTIHADVRLLAATNRNLEKAIAGGGFRADLYHRINVVTIHVPPLRKRREDIPSLVEYFLERFARELKIPKPPIAEDAVRLLENYDWPGNVRELEHCIQRVMIFTRGYTIQASDLPFHAEQLGAEKAVRMQSFDDGRLAELVSQYLAAHGGAGAHEHLVEKVETLLLAEALRRSKGNRTHAAKLLGMARPTLHAKMQKYSLRDESE
jgi:nitrogen regulation protein NR(I)